MTKQYIQAQDKPTVLLYFFIDATDEAGAELAAYAAQAELGDYGNINETDYSVIRLLPRVMDTGWNEEVTNCHRQLVALSRQESEQRFLWRVRKLARYGEQKFKLQPLTPGGKQGTAVLSARGIEIKQSSGGQGEQENQVGFLFKFYSQISGLYIFGVFKCLFFVMNST